MSLCPAQTLPQRDPQADRLLVIELRGVAVGDAVALHDGVGGEGAILGQARPFPTVAHQLIGKEKARALNARGQPEQGARAVLQTYRAQPVQRVGRGDPVVVEIFGVAVRRDDFFARVKGLVHPAQEVALEQIIRVEKNVGLKGVDAVITADLLKQELQGVALRAVLRVEALVADRAVLARKPGGVVRAVVCHDEHAHAVGRVVLPTDALHQIADDCGFISGSHDDSQLVILLRLGKAARTEQTDQRIK